ncbi:MAG: hypothetical protein IKV16_06380 [Clostridia bacterium]|nr:hypothetical protein [Clostridia bacterium]
MYYYSKKSKNKIVHEMKCHHIRNIPIDRIGWFETLDEAYSGGYRLCKHCSPIAKIYRREREKILRFARENGLAVNLGSRAIFIASPRSTWRIVAGDEGEALLYHKNELLGGDGSGRFICAFHLQRVKMESVIEYLDYIVKHDRFRMNNPLVLVKKKEKHPPRKGTRRYEAQQKRLAKEKRKSAIQSVLALIDSLSVKSSPSLATQGA